MFPSQALHDGFIFDLKLKDQVLRTILKKNKKKQKQKQRSGIVGILAFCPYFLKNLSICSCFETI